MKSKELVCWQELIEKMALFKKTEEPHRLSILLQECVRRLDKKEIDCAGPDFLDQLQVILETCTYIDSIAKDKQFRLELGRIILSPLLNAIKYQRQQSILASTKKYILQYLLFENILAITHANFCQQDCHTLKDYLSPDHKDGSYRLLNHLLKESKAHAQMNLQDLGEYVLVSRVLDY